MATKLPLIVRKSVRDDWETPKPGLEAEISQILGTPWTVNIDPAAVFVHAAESWAKDNFGRVIVSYAEGAVANLKRFVAKYGEDGTTELNEVAFTHSITLEDDDSGRWSYCGCDIKDGKLRILYGPTYLGTNVTDATAEIDKAVNDAPKPETAAGGLDFDARQSVKVQYESAIGALKDKLDKILGVSIKLTPNFEANFAILSKHPDGLSSGWQKAIGDGTLSYFESLLDNLKRLKFDSDEMLREGFTDVVNKNEVVLKVVDKLRAGSYNEVFPEDGVLYIQTIPNYWRTNTSDACSEILNVL
ncbi:MAG: hypothetical protein M1838_000929 [Thelocarpon superellum]|nr:MAG: hypothetical protein M1838_000929 [Thelocarpon superellum]